MEHRAYDVFLSHSSADKHAVDSIARRLQERGLHPFLDRWHVLPGEPWVPALAQALADSATAAVFFGSSAPAPWRNEELQLALDRAARSRADFRLIPVLLPGATPEQLAGFIGLRSYVDFRQGLDNESEFARLVAGIQGRAPAGEAPPLPEEPAPYRGLLAFDEAHGDFFFGREPDIERTLRKLARERFVAVVGPSGSGKSSLVLGGVLPRLKQPGGVLGPGVRTWTMRPGDRPLRALADAIAAREASGERRLSLSDSLHQRFLERPDGLRTALATLTADNPGPCVLVVDQFEELFTHAPRSGGPGEREPFLATLTEAVLEGAGPVHVLLTLRADFFDRCLELALLRQLLQDRTVLLGSLDEEALHDVILRPARKVGATLERGLLDTILREFSREPGALPLLEDTLDQLWRARKGEWLTLEAYRESGGISRALQTRAQACYDALAPEEREVARLLLVRLTSLGEGREDTRRRIPRTELRFGGIPEARVEHVLRVLSGPRARLIVVDQGSVEVAHEVLLLTWPTLRRWLDEDRRELRVERRLLEAATEWNEKGREAGYLSTGARLLEAEELFKHKPTLLNQLEGEFLTASLLLRDEHQREKEEQARRELESARRLAEETEARRKAEAESAARSQRSARQLRKLVLGLLTAVVGLLVASLLFYVQKRIASSRELVLSARQSIQEDPQRALLLLQEAQRLAPVDNLGEILDAWSQEPCLMVLRGNGNIIAQATFSPDGTRILTTFDFGDTAGIWDAASGTLLSVFKGSRPAFSREGARLLIATPESTTSLWDVSSGKQLFTLKAPAGDVRSVAFSQDGKRALTTSKDGTTRLWDASSGELLSTLQAPPEFVGRAELSPDGSRVVTTSDGGTARLWEALSGKLLFTLEGPTQELRSATFDATGSRVLTAYDDGTARLWEALSGRLLFTLEGHSQKLNSAVFSHDGSRVLTASHDETARLWDTATGKHLFTFHGHPGPVSNAAFNPDGSRILTTSQNLVKVWDVASGKPLIDLEGHIHEVASAEFSPDGERIVTVSYDGTARVWAVSPGKPLATFKHAKPTVFAEFSPDGTRLLLSTSNTTELREASSGKLIATLQESFTAMERAEFSPDGSRLLISTSNTTGLMEASSGKLIATLQGSFTAMERATFSPDGSRVLTTSADGHIHAWEISSGTPAFTFQGDTKAPSILRFSPDGTRLLIISEDGTTRLWEVSSGTPIATFEGSHRGSMEPAFSPDGSQVYLPSRDLVRSWEASSGKPLVTFGTPSGLLQDAALSPDGTRLRTQVLRDSTKQPSSQEVAPVETNTLALWYASSGKLLFEVTSDSSVTPQMEFSPDGSRLLIVRKRGEIGLWDTASGRSLLTIPTDLWPLGLEPARFSPDNSRVLAMLSDDTTGFIWDASTGERIGILEGHSARMNSMTFNRDGSYILTASNDGTARVWEGSSGQRRATLWGHSAPVYTALPNRDGSRLLTMSGRDNTVRLWPNWRWDAKAFAELDVGRKLTCAERREFLHENLDCAKEPAPKGPETSSATATPEH